MLVVLLLVVMPRPSLASTLPRSSSVALPDNGCFQSAVCVPRAPAIINVRPSGSRA